MEDLIISCEFDRILTPYKKKLKDSRWLNKRDEILKRDKNKCCVCGKKKNLNVHHLYYQSGKEPWDYDNESLVSLCNDCHEEIHKELSKLSGIIAFKILTGEIDLGYIKSIVGDFGHE